MTGPEKLRHRRKRRATILAVTTALLAVGLSLVVGTPSAAACDTECPGDNASIYYPPSKEPPVTVIKEVPTTITSYETRTQYIYLPTTVTETTTATTTQTVTTQLDPITVTVPVTETTTVTSLVPTTETVTETLDPDGIATSTENVTERVTATENVLETQQTVETQQTTETQNLLQTQQTTATVDVTRWNATAVNSQTGKTPAVTTTASEVSPGGVLTLSGDGYTPGEPIEIWLHSDPVLLETVNADANGQFQTAITIPVDTPVGQHTINVVGVTCGIETVVPLTVVSPPDAGASGDDPANPVDTLWSAAGTRTLSYTGVNTTMAGTVAALLIGSGLVLVIATRRRTGAAISMLKGGRHRG